MRKYNYFFASDRHQTIRNLRDLRAAGRYNNKLGLFLNGKAIGDGSLLILRPGNGHCVQTEYVGLSKRYKKKGHGIHLYLALIHAAKKIGAERIYSSLHLNKHSRRMWSEKLPKLFDVKEQKTRSRCRRCGHQKRVLRYYIIL